MRRAAPSHVRSVAALTLAVSLVLVPRLAVAQTASPPARDVLPEVPDTPRLAAPMPDGNWRPGATLPPRTPERNLFAAPAPVTSDSVVDGAFFGAVAGAGAMVAPSLLGRSRIPLVVGGLAGAAIGSVLDARHVTPGRRPAVVVLADGDAKALQLQWRF